VGSEYVARIRLGDSEVMAILASPRFAHLKDKPREELLNHLEEGERRLKRSEEALRIGVTVLDERTAKLTLPVTTRVPP